MVRVIPLGNHGLIRLAFGGEAVIHTDQDHLFEAQVIRCLQCHIGHCGPFPHPLADVFCKGRAGIGAVKLVKVLRRTDPLLVPEGDEAGHRQFFDILMGLFGDQIIHAEVIGRLEPHLGECKIDPVEPEGIFVPKL